MFRTTTRTLGACTLGLVALALTLALPAPTHAGVDVAREGAAAARAQPLGPPPADPRVPQNFGVIIESFDSPDSRPAGLGYDGEHLWLVTDGPVKTIWKLDPSDGSVVDSFPAPATMFAFGLDHAGGSLWGDTDGPDELYQADPADGTVLESFASPFAAPNGVTWDGADLWHTGFDADLALIDDSDGSTIRTIPAPGIRAARDTAWDGTTLWVVDANLDDADAIHRLDPADGSVLLTFVPVGPPLGLMYGLTYDGRYLWMSDLFNDQVHKIELALYVGVWASGTCPGPVELQIFGATPDAEVAIARGTGTGSFEIPGGPCAGLELGMEGVSLLATTTLDANGEATITGNLGPAACGAYLQVVDLEECNASYVSRTPRE